ncbi:ANTH domain-containing protein [Hyaloraphidium curvatum]|nr:ANTH domain-containing protein [Hyaloraphidium curvatum]
MSSIKQSTSVAGTYLEGDNVKRSVLKLTSPDNTEISRKHVDRVLEATRDRRYPVEDIFRLMKQRLGEKNWATSFKTLLLLHAILREGAAERIQPYLGGFSQLSTASYFGDGFGTMQDQYLARYGDYISERIQASGAPGEDFTRDKAVRDRVVERLRRTQAVPLMGEIAKLQRHIDALLKCKDILNEINNMIVAQCYQLLLRDLMPLFHVLNEAMICLLGSFFTLSKPDATKALAAYRSFLRETEETGVFFQAARRFRDVIAVDVPEDIKPAPQSLIRSLESYVKDPDFDKHRAQYLANKDKAKAKPAPASSPPQPTPAPQVRSQYSSAASTPRIEPPKQIQRTEQRAQQRKEPAVDFFSSLDEELGAFQASNQSWSPVFANAQQQDWFARPAYQAQQQASSAGSYVSTPPQGFGYGTPPVADPLAGPAMPAATGGGWQAQSFDPFGLQSPNSGPQMSSAGPSGPGPGAWGGGNSGYAFGGAPPATTAYAPVGQNALGGIPSGFGGAGAAQQSSFADFGFGTQQPSAGAGYGGVPPGYAGSGGAFPAQSGAGQMPAQYQGTSNPFGSPPAPQRANQPMAEFDPLWS